MTRAKVITAAALGLAAIALVLVVLVVRARLADDEPDPGADAQAALAARARDAAAQMAAAEAARARDAAARARGPGELSADDVTAQLLGEAPASLGPAMDGLRLGMPAPVPPPIDQRVRGFVAARGATLAYDLAPTLRGLTIEGKLARSDGALIEHALTTRWGKPERNRAGDLVWLNGPEGTRVVLDLRLDAVSVTYAQHVTPNDLVQPDEPGRLVFEPTGGLLGKPLADAEAYLGPRGAGPGGARWELAPTGLGRASAALRVEVNAAGRIVSMTYGEAEADCASLVTALERKLGAPTSVTSDGSLRNWADGGRLTSLLCDEAGRIELSVSG